EGIRAVLWLLLSVSLRLISLLPRPRGWRGEPRVWLPLGLALATGMSFATGSSGSATVPSDLFTTEREFERLADQRAVLLQHPPSAARRLDVLVVVLDSVRYDMLRPEVMPNLSALAGQCLSMRRHYTTGGNTGTGMFGLLSGLAAPYYPLAARARLQPIPLEILRRLGYRRSVYFVSNIRTYDGIFDLLFAGQVEHVYSGTETPTHVADRRLADDLLQQLRSRDPNVPQLSVVMFDSTHYDYSYPPEHERFLPQGTLELGVRDGLIVGAGINERLRGRGPLVRNRHQNAAHWLDALVGELTAFLGPEGLARTVLVVTSDHGEEFFEKGTFGHGFTLSEEATRVPLVLCAPGGVKTRYSVSSHADVIPTVFDLLGVDAGPAAVVSGKSWLRYDPTLDVALVGAGSTGQRVTRRFAAVGRHAKVIWQNAPPYEREAVWDEQDRPVAALAPLEADGLIARALISARLRPLPGPP
ncbi:MAG TPA: sulfatase-like hydrolase/transferase, partial [Polyangiaceae bacterium]|nr:sulfatase-like hydrolase/transferase [Polyangiaceae bacterium]